MFLHAAVIKWATMLAAVAARVEKLKHRSRTEPEQPASVELSDTEIRALILIKREHKKRTETVPDTMPTIQQAVRWIADIGGCVAQKGNGPPGSSVIARGLERVTWSAKIIEAMEKKR